MRETREAPTSDPHSRAPEERALLWAVVGACVAHVLLTGGDTIDDAYISLRYAQNLTRGDGLVFNPGERVEGYTNFLWVIVAAAAMALRAPPEISLVAVSTLACGVLAVHSVRRARALAADDPPAPGGLPAGAFTGALLATSTGLALHVNGGLESVAYAALLTLAGSALVDGRARAFAALTSLAFLTRPEGALLGLLGTAWLLQRSRRRAETLRDTVGVFALALAPYLAWKLWYYGALLPNTLRAKQPELATGLRYVAWLAAWAAALLGAASLGAPATLRSRPRRAYLAMWAAHTAAVALQGGDWMDGYRLLLPSLPWLFIALDAPLRALFARPKSPRGWVGALAALGALGWWLHANGASTLAQRDKVTRTTMRDAVRVALMREITAKGYRSVATFDIGLTGYAAPGLRVVDLGGLTDVAIARAPGTHWEREIPEALFAARAPDLALITIALPSQQFSYGVERRIVNAPWFQRDYRGLCALNVVGAYALVIYVRRGLLSAPALDGCRTTDEVFHR